MKKLILLTSTDSGVGVTACAAGLALRAGNPIHATAAVKLIQTGPARDAANITRISGCAAHEMIRLEPALPPTAAAARMGAELPSAAAQGTQVVTIAEAVDTLILIGTGGLLVPLDDDGGTVLDVVRTLLKQLPDTDLETLIVTGSQRGHLNHAALTAAVLRNNWIEPDGVIIGSWPDEPGEADRAVRKLLPDVVHAPLLGTLPQGAAMLDPDDFRAGVPTWFG